MVADIAFGWLDLFTVILLAFAIVLTLAGIFTTYFGNEKSKVSGSAMIITGLLIGVAWIGLCITDTLRIDVWHVFLNAFVNMVAVFIGASSAIAIFLVSVLKS